MSSPRGRLFLAAFAAGSLLSAAPAAGQDPRPAPVLKVNAAEITIGGRVHTQLNTTSVEGEQPSEILLRRVRLEATVRINDLVSGKIQPDFADDQVSLKDVYLKLDFDPGLQVLAGKAWKPFSLLEMTSSNRILAVERGLAIRGLEDAFDEYALVNGLDYSNRDIGLQVMGSPKGAPLGFGYQAGVFAGPLNGDVGAQDSYQYAARATVAPVRGLRLGGAWSSRHFAQESATGGDPELVRGNAWEVDAEIGSFGPGFHFLGEAVRGDVDPFAGSEFTGAQGWLAFRTDTLGSRVAHLEPTLRASWGRVDDDPDGRELGGLLLTPGFNIYFTPLNRVMFNYDVWNPRGDGETARSFKAQFQVAF